MANFLQITVVAGGCAIAAGAPFIVEACEKVNGPYAPCEDTQEAAKFFSAVGSTATGLAVEDGTWIVENNVTGDKYVLYPGESVKIGLDDKRV